MNLFFIHGGPGFNSEPDRLVLSGVLRDQGLKAFFWNEPSSLRPRGSPFYREQAYLHWINDLHKAIEAKSPELIVACSFGAQGLCDMLRLYPETSLSHIIFIGPTTNMRAVFKRMMEISENDLRESNPALAHKLRECRLGTQTLLDPQMQEGMGLVWQNEKLLSHYFVEPKILEIWAGVGADPQYAIDMESQNAVLEDFSHRVFPQPSEPLNILATVLSGSSDPVFSKSEVEADLKPLFRQVSFEQWPGCGHFPHLEKTTEFIQLVKKLTS